MKTALEVLRSGWYVLGNEVKSFEEEYAAYTGGNYCVGLASGLDALWIAFRLLGIGQGDEVIVQGNTHCQCHGHHHERRDPGFCGAEPVL
ncbi:MAG: DegT/DnrJ/EryC1/StrS family aminotransferase [Eubacteriales bacterium]